MVDIKNAAPMVIDQGTQDLSMRFPVVNSLVAPQHLPKIYIFAEKGPMGPNYLDMSSNSLTNVYGDETFNVNSKYYTHQTPFAQATAAAGNNFIVHRLAPSDAKDVANIAMYLDVLPAQVPLYEKNGDGSVKLDNAGAPVVLTDSSGDPITTQGYKICWVTDFASEDIGRYEKGLRPMRAGIQNEGAVQSQQYPIFEFSAEEPGEYGSRTAVRMYAAQQTDIYPFANHLLQEAKVYPLYFQLVRLLDPVSGRARPVLNGYGSQFSRFVTKKDAIDPTTDLVIDIKKTLQDQYIDSSLIGRTGLGGLHVYQGNLDAVLGMLYDAEKVIDDPYRDNVISTTENNIHAINVFSFTSSNASPYQAIKLVDNIGSVRLTKHTNIFMKGASDGTITEDLLDRLVAEDMSMYDDPTSEYNDIVLHPASILYDSGFSLATKKAMGKFISRRKDTFVALATYSHNNPAHLVSDQYSIGIGLKTMLELYPESDTFGTPVMRGIIMGSSGFIVGSPYTKRTPLTYELICKAARYMGAKNGSWRNGFAFDRAPNSIITHLRDIDSTWVPALTRNAMWAVGVNFPLNYRIKTQFMPALQTVYENDTSVLNSFFTVMAISYLNKIAHAAWREFTGAISLTNAQLEEQVNAFVSDQVKDKFDGKFVVVPNAKVTEADATRGFSWSLGIRIYSANMKTVMSTSVTAYRMEDLAAQT